MAVTHAALADLEQQLQQWSAAHDADQLTWASGYLAGVAAARSDAAVAAEASPSPVVTIWYGSETGNGRGVAERLAEVMQARGFSVDLAATGTVQPRAIGKLEFLLLVMSTHGEGDPPEDAAALHKFLMGKRAPRLEALRFAVFALGDSSYPDFCRTGRDFDARLEQLGARRLLDRVDVDVDFEGGEDTWRARVVETLDAEIKPGDEPAPRLQLVPSASDSTPRYDRRKPFAAEVLEVAPLTIDAATGPVCHVELDLADSGLTWQPGDSLGLWPHNDPRLVEELLALTALDGATEVTRDERTLTLDEWLAGKLELTQLTRPFLEFWAQQGAHRQLLKLLDDRDALARWVATRQVVDVVREFPVAIDADALVGGLRAIAPRLYSIASSPLVHEDEVHLTVKRVGGLDQEQRLRAGVASWQLTEQLTAGGRVPVYLESNPRFRLPENPDTPILMIGPGTGVAPFRAFVQQRQAEGATGSNWLLFGNRNRRHDFLYQLEWQRFVREGALHRLSVAFSRDQAERVYVQHRLVEHGREVYDWLEQGAHLYICGDRRMAEDVHRALAEIVSDHGANTPEQAAEYLESMKREKRYQKDVY
ncbi:MAG: assimilatory sulfite reductase (NADPH) flavoprotein subunit [Wenzhouxiangellaceae bacterium]|nr:assimilatory sulfite reductase (NADPH) flavoprotein subunit [Wenzhouxiangellaceae bacterium]